MTHKENIRAILECYFTGFKEEIIDSACNRILEQEPKTGHWIKSQDSYGNNHFTCPFCEHDIATKSDIWEDNYCSNCGAKMFEPQERGEIASEENGIIDEIFDVMKCFPLSYINSNGELIISVIGNVYFTATDCNTKEDIICKLLEWCSRPIAKGVPYAVYKKNIEWRNSLLCGYNKYLGTNFTQDDMYWVYDRLGNGVNHELTLEFIHSNYDLALLRPKKSEDDQ